MNKKFDRVLQWGKEKMGNDAKTTVSDDFKMMEAEMQLRHEGMGFFLSRVFVRIILKIYL